MKTGLITVLWEYAKDFYYYRNHGMSETKLEKGWMNEQIRLIKKSEEEREDRK